MSNLKAFLDTISFSEGTYEKGDNGYNVLVGGTLFKDYSDHPRRVVKLSKKLSSTAAGRYQILSRYFTYYKKLLNLPDFSPGSQDKIAIQLITEQTALGLVERGKFDEAVKRCSNIWASFPGAGYGQHENKIEKLRDFYVSRGGTLV